MRGWDFFYFSRRSRKQRSMAITALSPECEMTYSLLAEEYADQASLAMVCEKAIAAPPYSITLAGRLERFRKLMKKAPSSADRP